MIILLFIGIFLYLSVGLIVVMAFSAQMFLSHKRIFKWPDWDEWLFIVYSFTFIPFVWPVAISMYALFEMSFKKAFAEIRRDIVDLSNDIFGVPVIMKDWTYDNF